MNNPNQIPDDSDYYTAASEDDEECSGEDWRRCPCRACQGHRDDHADMMYERKRDEELGL